MQEWRSSYTVIVPEDEAKDLHPGDRVPIHLRPRIHGIVNYTGGPKEEKRSLRFRVREWFVGIMNTLFPKWMSNRRLRIEDKFRKQMADKVANAWKHDVDV